MGSMQRYIFAWVPEVEVVTGAAVVVGDLAQGLGRARQKLLFVFSLCFTVALLLLLHC